MAGTDSGINSFPRDANYMFHVLNVHYRFDGIKYLADWPLPGEVQYAGVDDISTVSNVRNAITGWLANSSGSNDVVFIFFACHGGGYDSSNGHLSDDLCIEGSRGDPVDEAPDFWNATAQKWVGVDEYLELADGNYWVDDLKTDLATLTYGKLVLVCEACFSGGLIDELSAPNRTILTAANETSQSYIGGMFTSWGKPFIDALHGSVGNWSGSTNRFSETGIECNADLDDDGSVSMWEAWNYSWWNDAKRIDGTETPWLDANGDGLPTYRYGADVSAPYEEPADRVEADKVWLAKKVVGDINNDGTVDIYDAILLANAFGYSQGESNWDRRCDLNTDGTIDIYDAIFLAGSFGKSMSNGSSSGASSSPGTKVPSVSSGASVLLDPTQLTAFMGETFSVDVKVTGVTDLRGWEFKLYWNSTVLNCTKVVVQTPSEWQNNTLNFGSGLEPNYNATNARYWQAQAGTYPASSFNGSMTMVTLTFQALQPGTTSLTLADVKLGNSTAQPIACSVSSGSVTVYYGRYMRSDTQTINGLGAYKLNIPESTSSASVTQSGDGHGASWGIRAWIRHSNGVEQEISLDGQTGTPKAVVYRTVGSGVQSNTVAVAQTALQQTDSLVIRVYAKVGTSDWVASATFTTEQLQASTLKATTWTLYYYTYAYYYRTYNFTTSTFYWGTTTYNSQIQNLQYT